MKKIITKKSEKDNNIWAFTKHEKMIPCSFKLGIPLVVSDIKNIVGDKHMHKFIKLIIGCIYSMIENEDMITGEKENIVAHDYHYINIHNPIEKDRDSYCILDVLNERDVQDYANYFGSRLPQEFWDTYSSQLHKVKSKNKKQNMIF